MTFVVITKAFVTVSRDGLLRIMTKYGCPPRYIATARQFPDASRHAVRMMEMENDGEYSEPFSVTDGVKQGVLWHQHCSFSECSQMLFRTRMLIFLPGTALMANYSS